MFSFVALLCNAQPPIADSVWPMAWKVNLTEGYEGKGSGPAQYWYDWSQKSEKWIRPTGAYAQDGVCHSATEPCIDLVTAGYRYIIHEETKDCCLLGTFDHGCGPVARDWIVTNNGTFAGKKTVDGVEVFAWTVQGFSSNTWYQTADADKTPVALLQGTYTDTYERASFEKAQSWPASTFEIPSYCSPSKKCASQVPCSYGRVGSF